MRRRWLCRLCSTTDDGYAGCAEGIEPRDAMTTMTCLFVFACFCLPLSVKPFLCPPVCSSCFAHLLLRASDVPAPQMSKSPLSLLAGYRLSRTWRPCAAAYQSCLYSSMLCLQTYAHTHAHIYTYKSTHFILDSHHPAMLGDAVVCSYSYFCSASDRRSSKTASASSFIFIFSFLVVFILKILCWDPLG